MTAQDVVGVFVVAGLCILCAASPGGFRSHHPPPPRFLRAFPLGGSCASFLALATGVHLFIDLFSFSWLRAPPPGASPVLCAAHSPPASKKPPPLSPLPVICPWFSLALALVFLFAVVRPDR